MKFEIKEFNVLTPFTVKDATVADHTNDSVIKIAGYCNWAGTDEMGKTYIDLAGDVVVPDGVDASVWQGNPQILWQHETDETIGKGLYLEKRPDGLYIEAEIHKDAMDPKDFYRIKSGLVCMFSIGFRGLDAEYKEIDGKGVFFITKSLLLEVSVVSLPCNSKSGFSLVKSLGTGVGIYADVKRPLQSEVQNKQEEVLTMKVKIKREDFLSAAEQEHLKGLRVDPTSEVEIDLVDLIKRVTTQTLEEFQAVAAEKDAKEAEALAAKAAEELAAKEESDRVAAAAALEAEAKAAEELVAKEEADAQRLVDELKLFAKGLTA